jgi:hypothetical protein
LWKFHFEHVARLDADALENFRQLVHQRDVEVTLDVLDHFRGLGGLDVRSGMDARGDDGSVHLHGARQRLCVVAADDLLDGADSVQLVAGIYALGGIAEGEVAELEAGFFF